MSTYSMDPISIVLDRCVRLVTRTREKTTNGADTSEFAIETWDEIELRRRMEEEEADSFCGDDNTIEEEELTGMVDYVREMKARVWIWPINET